MLTYDAIMVGVKINQTFDGGMEINTDMKEDMQI